MRANRPWHELVEEPGTDRHVVHLYRDEAELARVVAAWLAQPLLRGGGALLVCTPSHAKRVRDALVDEGVDVATADRAGALVVLDARETLARFLRAGEPLAPLFASVARRAIERVRAACAKPGAEVRAWGEMVDLLWQDGQRDAAQRLESLWNDAIDAHDFRLLCSYRLENLDEVTQTRELARVCSGHTHLMPESDADAFDAAVSDALVEVFGEREAGVVRATCARRRLLPTQMPAAEAVLVALHHEQPEDARRVLAATRRRLLGQRDIERADACPC